MKAHHGAYLVLLLSYGHQFANGQELEPGSFGRSYWASLYFFVLGCLAWGRFLAPLRFNLRHRLRVIGVSHEGPDMVSIYIGGRRLDEMATRAGQYSQLDCEDDVVDAARDLHTEGHRFGWFAGPPSYGETHGPIGQPL